MIDSYKTIKTASKEVLFKEKNSKFFGYAYPAASKEEIREIILQLKKVHPNAGHHCFAWQMGVTPNIEYRINDDGEPNGSAGNPIYGQIKSFELSYVLVVVVRYFGGTKLGVGGLISAYKNTAKKTLEQCEITHKTIDELFSISFNYDQMNRVMRIIKEKKLKLVSQKMELNCEIQIAVRMKDAEIIFNLFNSMQHIKISKN